MARERIARADYFAAMEFLRSALKQLERDPDSHHERAQCYIEMARCLNQRGEYASALDYARWAKNLLRKGWDVDVMLAEADLEIGFAEVRTGEYREAQRHLARAYSTFARRAALAKAAACLESIGVLARQSEQVARAINAFNFARQLYRQVEDVGGIQRTTSHLQELIPTE